MRREPSSRLRLNGGGEEDERPYRVAFPIPGQARNQDPKTADVAPDQNDDRISLASGESKGAKRRKQLAEGAEGVAVLADRITVFEEAFYKVAKAATKKKPSG